MKLTDQVSDLSKRIGALEGDGFDTSAGVARITKIYGNVKVTMTVTSWLHEYRKCGDTNPIYPSTCAVDTYL